MTRGSALLTAACQALFVGLAVGLFESTRTFARPISAAQGAEVLLVGGAAYALTALAATLLIAPWFLFHRPRGAAATGMAVSWALLYAARSTESLGQEGAVASVLWRLFIASAPWILLGVAVGLLTSRVAFLRRKALAAAAAGVMLGLALERLGEAEVYGIPGWLTQTRWVVSGLAVAGMLITLRWCRLGALTLTASLGLALALFAIAARPVALPRAEVSTPNILLITVDTLRADRVGAYGYEPAHTPNFDRLATEGLRFQTALTPIPFTTPAHASILTGLMPRRHGVTRNWDPIRERLPSLASRLKEQDYRTGAVVSALVLADSLCELAPHFHHYDDDLSATDLSDRYREIPLIRTYGNTLRRGDNNPWLLERRARRTTDRALAWLDQNRDAPFFLWVHYYDPHEPYSPPLEWARRFSPELQRSPPGNWYEGLTNSEKERLVQEGTYVEQLKRMYDGEIAYTDAQVGRLIQALDDWDLADNTALVLTSDHGEGLGEHDYYFAHGNYLYEEELRVPLLMRLPQGHPRRRVIETPVSLIDLTPTLLDYLGLTDSFPTEGQSLRPLIEGQDQEPPRPTFHGVRPGAWDSGRSIYAVRTDRHKLIWTGPEWRYEGQRIASRSELYDLVEDPGETVNLVHDAPPVMPVLLEMLRKFREWRGLPTRYSKPDAEMMRRLEALGYAGE